MANNMSTNSLSWIAPQCIWSRHDLICKITEHGATVDVKVAEADEVYKNLFTLNDEVAYGDNPELKRQTLSYEKWVERERKIINRKVKPKENAKK